MKEQRLTKLLDNLDSFVASAQGLAAVRSEGDRDVSVADYIASISWSTHVSSPSRPEFFERSCKWRFELFLPVVEVADIRVERTYGADIGVGYSLAYSLGCSTTRRTSWARPTQALKKMSYADAEVARRRLTLVGEISSWLSNEDWGKRVNIKCTSPLLKAFSNA